MSIAPQQVPNLLSEKTVEAKTTLSRRTLQGMRLRGEGPPFVKLGAGPKARVAYVEADVLAWIERQRRTFTGQRGAA